MYIAGLDPERISADAEFLLGQRGVDDLGREFVYLKATAVGLVAGQVVIIHADGTAAGVTTTLAASGTGAGKQLAVAMTTVTASYYFWGCIYSPGVAGTVVSLAATVAVFTRLRPTAAVGVLDDTTTHTEPYCAGIVTTVATSGSALTKVGVINYPFLDVDLTS